MNLSNRRTINFTLSTGVGPDSGKNARSSWTNRYIIVLHNDVASPGTKSKDIEQLAGGRLGFIYEHAFKGFSIQMPEQAVAGFERNPNVTYVANMPSIDRPDHALQQESMGA